MESLARPLERAGVNATLIQIVVPYVLDTLETYMLTPDDLAWMTQLGWAVRQGWLKLESAEEMRFRRYWFVLE